MFISLQTALGTGIPAGIVDVAHDTLARVALGPRRVPGGERVLAAETLVRLGSRHGLDALAAMAADPAVLHTVDPRHVTVLDVDAHPTELVIKEARADTARDTLAKLDDVVADPTLDAAARDQAARVRAAFRRHVENR